MKKEELFFRVEMPSSRIADYHLGCFDGSVFLDINISTEKLVSLVRISFDGFGNCDLSKNIRYLNAKASHEFLKEINKNELNQKQLKVIIKQLIAINKENIWKEALLKYKF